MYSDYGNGLICFKWKILNKYESDFYEQVTRGNSRISAEIFSNGHGHLENIPKVLTNERFREGLGEGYCDYFAPGSAYVGNGTIANAGLITGHKVILCKVRSVRH